MHLYFTYDSFDKHFLEPGAGFEQRIRSSTRLFFNKKSFLGIKLIAHPGPDGLISFG